MSSAVSGKRVLVTGAGGFIGSHLVRALLARGAEVYAMSASVSSLLPVRLADVWADIHIVEANVADRSAMDAMAKTVKPEYVAHLAAFTHVGKSFRRVDENIATNIQGTVNLLQALDGNYERFVYTGTSEIYGDIPAPFREDAQGQPSLPVLGIEVRRGALLPHVPPSLRLAHRMPSPVQRLWALADIGPDHP